jgi:hypothetical protein
MSATRESRIDDTEYGAALPPAPVRDLDWPAERARELGAAVVELWGELLERLPEMPVSRPRTAG